MNAREMAENLTNGVNEFMPELKGQATAAPGNPGSGDFSDVSGTARMPQLEELINRSEPPISTGFPTLDTALGDGSGAPGGLTAGLYTVGAISSLGKTTFAMQMADTIAASGKDVIVFTVEMAATDLMARSISRLTEILSPGKGQTLQKILHGERYAEYSPQELQAIEKAKAEYSKFMNRIFFLETAKGFVKRDPEVDDPDLELKPKFIREIVDKFTRKKRHAPIVFVDYLQILAPGDRRATDKANIDSAMRKLKIISRDFHTPIVLISSFNRATYDKPVSLQSLKESGAIEYTSDAVIALQWKGIGKKGFDENKKKREENREIEAVILKNRNGAAGNIIEFLYDTRFYLFRDQGWGEDNAAGKAGDKAKDKPKVVRRQ